MIWEELAGKQNQSQSSLELWFCARCQREKFLGSGLWSSQTPTTLSVALAAGCRSEKWVTHLSGLVVERDWLRVPWSGGARGLCHSQGVAPGSGSV